MNIVTETKRRLEYQGNKIKELQECFGKAISLDAQIYIKDEISKAEKNEEYYSLILKKLEVL